MEVSKISLSEDAMHILQEKQNLKYEGLGGGGLVKVSMAFDCECDAVTIAPEFLDDGELLEELLINAINNAVSKVSEAKMDLVGHFTKNMSHLDLTQGGGDGIASFKKFVDKLIDANVEKLNDSCDCSVCEKTATCPVRFLKESLDAIEEDSRQNDDVIWKMLFVLLSKLT